MEGLERYTDIVKLGNGSYGVIKIATDRISGQKVALKYFRTEEECEGASAFTLREVTIMVSMDHPNLMKVINIIYDARKIVIVMPFMQMNLGSYVHRVGALPIDLLRSYAYQLIAAVYYLHTHSVMHRDLKSTNIMLDRNGGLVLIDFGMARHFAIPLQQYTPGVQTLNYRAPEVMFAPRGYTPAVDMWSVGCVIAEMAIGTPLFTNVDSDPELAHKIIELFGAEEYPCTWPQEIVGEHIEPKTHLRDILITNDEYLCDLITELLRINPIRRCSALDALRHPFFDSLPVRVRQTSTPDNMI